MWVWLWLWSLNFVLDLSRAFNLFHFQVKVHEASLQALLTKQREASQICLEALQRERQKCDRTIAITTDELVSENSKTVRKMDREWDTTCNALKKHLGSHQTQVVHLELMCARIERASKEREEALQRKEFALRVQNSVSRSSEVMLLLHLF